MSGTEQFNIDGRGDMVGVVFGGTGNQASGTKTTLQSYGAGAAVTVPQVMERLDELTRTVQGSTMSNQLQQDTLSNVQTAREALARDTPAVARARHSMEGTLQELKGGGVEGATAVVTLVTGVVEMLRALAG